MDISEILSIALPVVYVIVGAVLVWLVIELVMTVRKTRKTVDDLQRQVEVLGQGDVRPEGLALSGGPLFTGAEEI